MLAGGTWLSAKEIADLRLPGLPADKRKVTELIALERWATRAGADGKLLNRQRKGRGGGYEWHSSLLPERARTELVRRGVIAAPIAETSNVVAMPKSADAAWAQFERLPAVRKTEAADRLAVIDAVERHVASGATKTRATQIAAQDCNLSAATINNWFALIAGIARPDRLAHLAPATKGGGKKAEIDPDLWDRYRSDWLRPEKPTHAACYWRIQRIATARGLTIIPSAKTFQRKLEAETPPEVILACREGRDRVAQIIPAQIRTVAHLHAMHTLNIDGHRWDVNVLWPDGTIERPLMVGIQDVFSRKLLAWRIDKQETAVLTRLAFADVFRNFGIPVGCLLDNGKAFASKWITGGSDTRYRFKIRQDEPLGLLTSLGVKTHWATPYHGQAKPIERYWRMVCNMIATGPDFAGAYCGNSPSNKPHNFGERAIPLAEFERVIARELAAVNAKPGRRTEMAFGGSFDQVFERSIAAGAPVGRASDAQMRLALLAADRLFADRKTGAITYAGNRYWSPEISSFGGQRLTIRFDPDNLHSSVFAYDAKDQFIAELPVWEATGFLDVAGAKTHAKLVGDHRKAVRAAVKAEGLLDAAAIARGLRDLGELDAPMPEPTVLRPVRQARRGAAAAALADPDTAPIPDFNDRFRNASERLRLVE